MSNPIYDGIVSHRSIRNYKTDPIPQDILNQVLTAATRGSTSGNMQTYSMIITQDAERKKQLWEYHSRQNMILQAPVLITFLADWHRMIRWCDLRNAKPGYNNFLSFMVAVGDAFIAAQNAALAAEGLGLGICYMGTTHYCTEKLIEFFNLPQQVYPITTLVVGYPDEDIETRDRLPIEGIVHHEVYDDKSDNEILGLYKDKEKKAWDRNMSVERARQVIKEAGVENVAQIYTQLKYTLKHNLAVSDQMLKALEEQGFLGDKG